MTIEERLEAASAEAMRKVAEREQAHAEEHGLVKVRRIRIEQRRGYRGRMVCADCYYGGKL